MSPNTPHCSSEDFVDNNAAEIQETSQHNTTPMQTRQKFFCGLLDSRKAVIIINALAIIGSGLLLIPAKLRTDAAIDDVRENETYSGNEIKDKVDILDRLFWYTMILTLVGFIFRSLAIHGAIRFCPRYVIFNIIYMIVNVGLTLRFSFSASGKVKDFDYGVGDWIPKIIGTAIAVLVHITLVREIKMGVTTKETYPPEEKTCCCVV